ncbi:protein of unknown function [Trichlorobacter ammonificans]|uniref:Uncharacterized protein n=1 Tax=Trichlorobacter ammonificans TaxID=2916410 RepID=A0ABN8HLN1_9BACT|nr:protein of unknown function [Trichlorobacter ammonificans]
MQWLASRSGLNGTERGMGTVTPEGDEILDGAQGFALAITGVR